MHSCVCFFFFIPTSDELGSRASCWAHHQWSRDTFAHAAPTRVHRPRRRYASLATPRSPWHHFYIALFSRALRRAALARARVVRAAIPPPCRSLSARRVSVFLLSRARSSVAVAARPGRGALSESYARAGLTARRARRPGGGTRPSVPWPPGTTFSTPSKKPRRCARRMLASRARASFAQSSYRAVTRSPDGVFGAIRVPASVLPRVYARSRTPR